MKSRSLLPALAISSALVLITLSACAKASADGTSNADASVPAVAEASELAPAVAVPETVAEASEFAPAAAAPETVAEAPQETALEEVVAAAPESSGAPQGGSVLYEPPVQGQGGTCITGSIIDVYHQAVRDRWTVQITSDSGVSVSATADSDGKFRVDNLGGGTWTVELKIRDGWRQFTPASFPVTLSGSGTDCAKVRFKVETLACLDVFKWDARGGKGYRTVGIPGWLMTATQGTMSLSQVTDGQGKTTFWDLAPGTWTVQEESKTGWTPAAGYPSQQTIQLKSPHRRGECQSLHFVNQQIFDGCIQVRKVDAAGNPLAGWTVTLTRDDGTQPSRSQLTDAAGYTTFCGLALGEWTVREDVKPWWRPIGSDSQPVNLTDPGRTESVTFQNEALGCIDGFKINHLEDGLPGWTITVENSATGESFTKLTDGTGYFRFEGLKLGTWKVAEVLESGWVAVTPAEFEVQVDERFACQRVRFKNRTDFACVDVYKKDAADESGLPGWEITLQPAYGGTPVSGTTDGTGHVRFNGLTPGAYTIAEKVQEGWYAVGPQSQQLQLEASGTCAVVTFWNRQGTSPPHGRCRATHWVKPGNTLYSIARWYGTTVAALKRANGLVSDTIYAYRKLCIP